MMISELEFCAVWNRANLANWENENKKSYSKLWEKEVLNIYALYLYIYRKEKSPTALIWCGLWRAFYVN